jgi:hypothetical protein
MTNLQTSWPWGKMKMIRTACLVVCFIGSGLALAACGSIKRDLNITQLGRTLVQRGAGKAEIAASQQAVLQVTRAQVDAVPLPLIRVRLEGTSAMSTMVELDRKGPFTTFMTGDGIALLFKGGVLVGSRGLGQDLMGLSTPSLSEGIRSGESQRAYRYLDGDEKLETTQMSCQLTSEPHGPITILERSYNVDQVREWCRGTSAAGADIAFENFYWVESRTGIIWQSRQFISTKFGRAEIEVLTLGKK